MAFITRNERGFTLIELSIVLVVIGLIVGGVLAGRDLLGAASARAEISQVEKLNTAVNTFKGKYDALPGDISAGQASTFGFAARAGTTSRGDGNGIIEGTDYAGNFYGWNQNGETLLFWVDLSRAGLIEGTFNTATDADIGTINSSFDRFLPPAKIGNGNYLYVWSGGPAAGPVAGTGNAINYLGVSVPVMIQNSGNFTTNLGMTVLQASSIDKKNDDGLPTTGKVTAMYSSSPSGFGTSFQMAPNAASPSSATCYDTTSNKYSLLISGGNNINCGLTFQFH